MDLIDKEDDVPVALLDFFQDSFQTLLKLAAVLSTGNQGTHIQREDRFIFQGIRNIAFNNTLCKSFHNCSLADTRLTDQDRIVLGFSGKDPDHILNLIDTADDRIQFLLFSLFNQICSIFIQCFIGGFRIVRGDPLITSDS